MKIAILSEDTGHLTGGRYYVYFLASALVELGHDVTLYTNQKAVFASYFDLYKKPKISVSVKTAQDLQNLDIEADVYIGSPINGSIGASRLGTKYGKPSYVIIYDPLPMIEFYRKLKVNTESWKKLQSEVSQSNSKIITLCAEPSKFVKSWLKRSPDQIIPIYPCINSKVKNKVRKPKVEKDYAVWISRIVSYKRLDHALYACRANNIPLKIIASIDGIGAKRLIRQQAMTNHAEVIMAPSDIEKFKIIRGAKVLLHSSVYEGFGIPTVEALSCGVPVVAYDYPTTREIAEVTKTDMIYFAKFKNYKDFSVQLRRAWREGKKSQSNKSFDFEALVLRCKEVFGAEL